MRDSAERKNGFSLRCHYHIERDFFHFSDDHIDFFWFLKYHQVRFVSFAIWFIGLFLTDFTSIVATPGDNGWEDVLLNIKIISITHLSFIVLFQIYLIISLIKGHLGKKKSEKKWKNDLKLVLQSLFDMSIHLDIHAIIFAYRFIDHKKSSMFILEALTLIDAILTVILTPFKIWRALVDFFGVLPSLILAHVSLYKPLNYLFVFLPITIVLVCPLLFTLLMVGCKEINEEGSLNKFIRVVDPSLLPNQLELPKFDAHSQSMKENPISKPMNSGKNTDYFDFKSIPAFVLATFLIHYGCFAQEYYSTTYFIIVHYFLTLIAILINTRVVSFPALIFTNVKDDNGPHFNPLYPELSFI